jgi:saccharopine dehydrogenase (NAD+, L-lysine forming)
MGLRIGIRRENKNKWERRVPLVPSDLAELQQAHGLKFVVQPSEIRTFSDAEYRAAGLSLDERMRGASMVFGVKEVPVRLLRPSKVYVFFAHVVKGQAYNMPMLRRLMEFGCSLVDYERIADDNNRRLVFFGRHAGNAGMIETLRGLGLRLAAGGQVTPLAEVKPAYEYHDLADAKAHLRELGARIASGGIPDALRPLVIGVAGYGNVSEGAQDVLGALPVESAPVHQLKEQAMTRGAGAPPMLKVVFREEDMVRPVDPQASFALQDYYQNPERYAGRFEEHLDHLDVLVNCIYWEPRYPRLVTKAWAAKQFGTPGSAPRLKIVGDISCDIDGSIELTAKASTPDDPCFVYEPVTGKVTDGVQGPGLVIMSVDNLPCELSRESSQHFSAVLKGMVPELAAADWQGDFDQLNLPSHLKKAVIVHKGELTPGYAFLKKHLAAAQNAKTTSERRQGLRAH